MKLILSTYLRTLKERDEFDALFPDLLNSMGIVPLSKPQTGTRQYGVDLPAVGRDPDDGDREKLFLFVLKQGDIDRNSWDSGPQSVRQSLNEILDVYLASHVAPEHIDLPKKLVLSTTGDLKEAVNPNWVGYIRENASRAEFDFWGADRVALLIERHMLDEHVFKSDDRIDLRRALALAGEIDYSLSDFYRLLERQLGLTPHGECESQGAKLQELIKALERVNLATRLLAGWSTDGGNSKNALIAAERSLLWAWHRLQFVPKAEVSRAIPSFLAIWQTYLTVSIVYFEKLKAHCHVRDGLSGYTHESSLFSLKVFEQIGLLASIGLAQVYYVGKATDDQAQEEAAKNAELVANALIDLIKNNQVSGSPSLDENALDITLAQIFLNIVGRHKDAENWLGELVRRIDYTFRVKRHFPVGTDSMDDVIALGSGELDEDECKKLMGTSWMLPTLAGWSVILECDGIYAALFKGQRKQAYAHICAQLWHPVKDLFSRLYFQPAHGKSGEAEAPISFPEEITEYRDRMLSILDSTRHNILDISPAYQFDLMALDLIACRHFRTPVAPYFWYQFAKIDKSEPTP